MSDTATPLWRECIAVLDSAKDRPPDDILAELLAIVVQSRRQVTGDDSIPADASLDWLQEIGNLIGNPGALPMALPQFLFNYVHGYSPGFMAALIKACPHEDVMFGEYNIRTGMEIMQIPVGKPPLGIGSIKMAKVTKQ